MSGKKHPLHFAGEVIRGGGRLLDRITRKRFFYHSTPSGRLQLKETWGNFMARSDFPQKFLRLTSGLDEKACETVVRILMRINKIIDAKKTWLDIFTREEQEELHHCQEIFFSEIMKVSEDVFAWRNYLLPRRDAFQEPVFVYRHGLSTLKTLDSVKGKAVIDAGGCIGDSALVFAELGASVVYTFEPVPENFELLKRTLELNHITNAVPECIALGSKNGTATMCLNESNIGGSTIETKPSDRQGEHINVPLRRLDDYVAERQIKVGLIKTDIEGAEPDFLEGAKKTICEQKPILLISIYHNPHDFFEIKPLIESWDLGYRFSVYHPPIWTVYGETLLIGEIS